MLVRNDLYFIVVVSTVLLGQTGMSGDISCKQPSDCNAKCAVCADSGAGEPARCVFPFSYMYTQGNKCRYTTKCENTSDCSGNGMCDVTYPHMPPSCHCSDFHYGFDCKQTSHEPTNLNIIMNFNWKFSGIIGVGHYKTLKFYSVTRNNDKSTSKTTYMSLKTGDGYYVEIQDTLRRSTDARYLSYLPKARFPFKPFDANKNDRVLNFRDTVEGYLKVISISARTNDMNYYNATYTVFVTYKQAVLECIPIIKLENCGPTVDNPTTFTSLNFIDIPIKVTYLADGSYVTTSVHNPDCADSATMTYKVWKLSNRLHNELVDAPMKESYTFKPLNFDAYTLTFGNYKIMVEVKNVQIGKKSVNFAYCYFKVKSLPLVAIIDGGNDRKVFKPIGLYLIARRSHDPNQPATTQGHVNIEWSCQNVLNPKSSEDVCKPRQLKPFDVYFIPPKMLTYGAVYNFTLKVWTDIYDYCADCTGPVSPRFAYVRIQVANESEKVYDDLYINCVQNCGEKVVPNRILFLKAGHKSGVGPKIKEDYNWMYYKGEETVTSVDSIKEEGLPSHFLIVKEGSLERGAAYTIFLQGISTGLLAKYTFETDNLTYEGSCSVYPIYGTKGLTCFDLLCTYHKDTALTYEFYDKTSEEVGEDVIFNGRMLGTSHNGRLLGVSLTRGNVLVYVINDNGLFINEKIEVKLSDWDVTIEVMNEINRNLKHNLKHKDISSILQYISFVPDIIPSFTDKNVVLNTLLSSIAELQLNTLTDVKLCASTLSNALLTLNKPTQLTLTPRMMTSTLGVIKIQVDVFRSYMLNRARSRWMSPKEIRLLVSSILTCLHAILRCKDSSIEGKSQDNLPLHVLCELRQGSLFVEKTTVMIKDVLSYIQSPGQPPSKVSSANDTFVVWVMENDASYPFTNYLKAHEEIPVNVPKNLLLGLENGLRPEEHLGLQAMYISENVFWWCLSDVKSNLVSMSLTRHKRKQKLIQIKSVETPLDLYIKLDSNTSNVKVTRSTLPINSEMSSTDKDIRIRVHRIDRPPRSLTCITFLFPPTSDTLRVLALVNIRPDYEMMETKSLVLSQRSPSYPLESYNQESSSFLFVGILPGNKDLENQSVLYSFEVNTTLCQYWANGQWSSLGCQITAGSSVEKVHCQCSHFSIFAAAFPVPPQEIDPFEDAKLFLTVLQNPLAVAFVLTILVIYLLICLWAWRKDRIDKLYRTVIVLDDNYPTDRYPYLLAVYTSSRFNAGTSAHVGLRLIGQRANSRAHVLSSKERKVLKKNTDDWFLVYCPDHLGDLEGIHMWHDNYGWSPEWFCDKIHVFDLTRKTENIFIVEQWLALTLKDHPEVKLIPASSLDFMSVKMLFIDNFLGSLRDGHVFLSILLRHPRNEVSRLQRVSVFMCCIMVVMFCSIMFYIPADEMTSADDYQFEVGTRELFISIQCLVVSGFVTFILLYSFRRSYKLEYTRVRSTTIWRNDSCYRSATKVRETLPVAVSTTSVYSESLQDSSTDSKSKPLSRSFGKAVVHTFKSQALPPVQLSLSSSVIETKVIWLICAWGFCIITIIICSYLVMLYGLKLGLVNSKKWLSSVLLTVVEDIFIIGPLRIILISFVLTIAFQRVCEVNTHVVDVNQALKVRKTMQGDDFFMMKWETKRCHPMYAPLRDSVRQAFINKKEMWKRWWLLVDFIISAGFVFVVSTNIYRLWSSHFLLNDHVRKLMTITHLPEMGSINFDQVRTITGLENYFQYTLMYVLYDLRWYNDDLITQDESDKGKYWASDFTNRMVGLPLLRQNRVISVGCGNIVLHGGKCIPHWSPRYEDTDIYGVGWTTAKWGDAMKENFPWKYTDKSTTSLFPLYRLYGASGKLFGRGGYMVTLGPTRQQAELTLAELKENLWQDPLTVVMFVELTLYNVNLDQFSQVTLIVEYMIEGEIQLKALVTSVDARIKLSIWIVIFAVYIMYYLFRCLYLINRLGLLTYLSMVTNVCRLVVITLGFLTIVLYLMHYYTLAQYFKSFQKSSTDNYLDFDALTVCFFPLRRSFSLLLCFAILRMFTLLRVGRTLITHCYTILISLEWIFWLTLILACLLFILRLSTYLLNVATSYGLKELVERRRSMRLLTLEDIERTSVRVFMFVQAASMGLCVGCFIVLFLYYSKAAQSYRLRDSDSFNFGLFLQSELTKLRKPKRL